MLLILGIVLIFLRFLFPPQACLPGTNFVRRAMMPGESVRTYTLQQLEATRGCHIGDDYKTALQHSMAIAFVFGFPYFLYPYLGRKRDRQETISVHQKVSGIIQKTENYLFSLERGDRDAIRLHPYRWAALKPLVIILVAIGAKLASGDIGAMTNIVGITTAFRLWQINEMLKSQNADRNVFAIATLSLVVTTSIAIWIILL